MLKTIKVLFEVNYLQYIVFKFQMRINSFEMLYPITHKKLFYDYIKNL